jgi:hypothetical protein
MTKRTLKPLTALVIGSLLVIGNTEQHGTLSAPAAELLELLYQRVDDGAAEFGAKQVLDHPDDAAHCTHSTRSAFVKFGWDPALLKRWG